MLQCHPFPFLFIGQASTSSALMGSQGRNIIDLG